LTIIQDRILEARQILSSAYKSESEAQINWWSGYVQALIDFKNKYPVDQRENKETNHPL
jgi:hypothetical protein